MFASVLLRSHLLVMFASVLLRPTPVTSVGDVCISPTLVTLSIGNVCISSTPVTSVGDVCISPTLVTLSIGNVCISPTPVTSVGDVCISSTPVISVLVMFASVRLWSHLLVMFASVLLRSHLLAVSAPLSEGEGSLVQLPGADGKLHWINMDGRFTSELKVTEDDVTFLLYTRQVSALIYYILHVVIAVIAVIAVVICPSRQNPSVPSTLVTGVDSSLGNFNPNRDTKFVIHGFFSDGNSMKEITEVSPGFIQAPVWVVIAVLCHQCPPSVTSVLHLSPGFIQAGEDYNMIVVDWSGPANGLSAQAATVDVGTFTARLIEYLVTRGLSTANIDLIGFSLGAHVAAIAADRNTAGRIGRITGLDPVGRRYEKVPLEDRLDITDGDFVQVIHTNGGFIGWGSDLGHVDFYPNDGNKQYGCGIDPTGACSHLRAVAFYAESITSSVGFHGTLCGSWSDYVSGTCSANVKQRMGAPTPNSARGSFYLWTKNSKPYALGL
uniref:Lipase domain-containing protein n=1 Tax=Timema poppense TaxID=170557 RepID=A0A7R9DR60_TIMPO|nr:unnamed protein product [Timema poppensis]